MTQTRRKFLQHTGVGLLTFYVSGCEVEMSPQEAREQELPYGVLSSDEVQALEALGEVLLPGSAAAGLAHFIDHQLGATPDQQLLMIRYLGVNPPFTPFYRGGLAALDTVSQAIHGTSFAGLDQDAQVEFVGRMAQSNPDGWEGPPAPFFYFALRADAVDVVYGTKNGVESLGIPYMAHIEPPSKWGQ